MSELRSITDVLADATRPNCEVCFGEGLVCESHPMRPWEAETAADCQCGAPGMPCVCTGLQNVVIPIPGLNGGNESGDDG